MVLWSTRHNSSCLLNLPFQASSAMHPDKKVMFAPALNYVEIDAHPTESKPNVPIDVVDMPGVFDNLDIGRHVFPTSGSKSKPLRIDVNGRESRRAACVLYRDAIHYDVFDLDGVLVEGSEEGSDGEAEKEN